MDKKKIAVGIVIIILVLTLISFSSSKIILKVFNNSLSTENLTFTGDENITRYLDIYRYANVTKAEMNLTGYDDGGNIITNPFLEILNNNTRIWYKDIKFPNKNNIIDEYNDTQTSKKITFTGDENNTYYISIPKESSVISAYINIEGNTKDIVVEQEDPNATNYSNGWINPTKAYDGIYDRGLSNAAYLNISYESSSLMYFNWTIPTGASADSELYGKYYYDGTAVTASKPFSSNNVQFPTYSCSNAFEDSILQTRYSGYSFTGASGETFGLRLYCYDGSSWKLMMNLFASGGNGIIEDRLEWHFPTYPNNPYLEVGNTDENREWSYSGNFSSSIETGDFSEEINNYLSSCSSDEEGYCDVPIIFHSESYGELYTSDLNITFTNSSLPFNEEDKTDDFSSILNEGLVGGNCPKGELIGKICRIPFTFHSDTQGILNYDLNNTIEYDAYPHTELISPENNTWSPEQETFICNSTTDNKTELTNITFYLWNSTNNLINETSKNIIGKDNETSFNITFDYADTYKWNCLTYNNESLSAFAEENNTININLDDPIIYLESPNNNSYLNYMENIEFNYTSEHSTESIDTCELWGNFNGTWHLNQSDSTIDESNINTFKLNITNETEYKWSIKCNLSGSGVSSFSQEGNYTFEIDKTLPKIEIIKPTDTPSSLNVEYEINITELNPNICYYNITTGASLEKINTFINCSNLTGQFQVSSDNTIYTMNFFINDTAGNFNTSNKTFFVSSPNDIPSGGGGGGSQTILVGGETGWTMEASGGLGFFDTSMVVGTSRELNIGFENVGDESRTITLFCENINNSNGCQYVSFPEKEFNLPLITGTKTNIPFKIIIPKDAETGVKTFNIIAVDDLGRKGAITTNLVIQESGFFTKLFSRTESGFPYLIIWIGTAIISLIISLTIFNKSKLRIPISIASLLIIPSILISFI